MPTSVSAPSSLVARDSVRTINQAGIGLYAEARSPGRGFRAGIGAGLLERPIWLESCLAGRATGLASSRGMVQQENDA